YPRFPGWAGMGGRGFCRRAARFGEGGHRCRSHGHAVEFEPMPNPVLLVHDDVSQIAAVRRLLDNEGCDVTLATSAGDAAVGFGNCRPRLVVLAPGVEGGRGQAALESLRQHPQWSGAKLLLLGGPLEACDAPVLSLPLDGAALLDAVHGLLGPDPAPPA